jgi:hypothetical protein
MDDMHRSCENYKIINQSAVDLLSPILLDHHNARHSAGAAQGDVHCEETKAERHF